MLSCLSNTLMPGIVKITIDMRETAIIMDEANREDEWKPLPYELLYVKKFPDNDLTRELVDVLLNRLNHVGNGFFRNTLKDVVDIFDTITGRVMFLKSELNIDSSSELYLDSELDSKSELDSSSEFDIVDIKNNRKHNTISEFCRVLSECCTNGQQIRHTIRNST